MPSLLEAQRGFAAALLGAGGPPRMAVYRANAFGNWRAALEGAYPIVCRIVGTDYFAALAHRYAHAFASVNGDLHEYGARLAPFLEGHAGVQDLSYLADVARMEWLAHLAHYAADAAPFDFSRPTEVRLAPACGLLRSDWPLAQIWAAHQEGGDPASVNLGAGPDRILVHRAGWRVETCSLAAGDYAFLERLRDGATLGAALEAAAAADAAFLPGVALPAWVQAGVVVQ
jgi:hypothetical protein